MKKVWLTAVLLQVFGLIISAQQGFFLDGWGPRSIDVPEYTDIAPVNKPATISLTIMAGDTLTRIPAYMFGDNVNAYTTSMSENKTLMGYLSDRKMGVLRGPSGSISDVFFWNRSTHNPPADVPDSLLVGGDHPGWEWYGKRPDPWEAGWTMDIDSFYRILAQTGVTGMLTVNYGYARYGTSDDPVAQAAHLAADWVRYDNGRTKFWEIGNEVFGNWEAGYRINTALNKDGQPEYITSTLYGQHCRVFIDSMKAAASEIGAEIYIGAVAAESSNTGSPGWNVGLMQQAGNDIDFYIIHSYYTPYNQNSNASVLLNAPAQTQGYMDYLESCAAQAGVPMKPVALTEYNTFAIGSKQAVSQIGGQMAVMVTGEAIKAGIGAACRWDLANGWNNGDDHGMFSYGEEPGVSRFSPRPAFYYLYYMQKYLGNVLLTTSIKGTADVKAYSSSFTSGHISTTLSNKGATAQVARLNIQDASVGDRYYIFTLVGGTDVPADPLKPFSRMVYVNGTGPSGVAGGPLTYKTIAAKSGLTGNEILVELPPYSVAYVLVDTGNKQLVVNDTLYPVVLWNAPANIIYGTRLSNTQLNATANMTGSYVYDPPVGTKLNAGNEIALEVTFTPADANFSPVTKTVLINVMKANPVIQWNTPEDVPAGTALDELQLNATANVEGTFEYDPPAGTILDAGSGQVLQVTFTPADTADYNSAAKTTEINVYSVTKTENEISENILLFPVPVKNELSVSGLAGITNGSITLQIVSMDGSMLYKSVIEGGVRSKTIQVNDLPDGMYMLQILTPHHSIIKRFTKQK